MEKLTIKSGQGDYDVHLVPDIAAICEDVLSYGHTVVVIDAAVASAYEAALEPITSALPTMTLEATEENKTLSGAERVLTFLQQHNATKQTRFIAIGGGVIQDIATFAAHVYYRGLQWTLVPTTLLGMCDSCIGAKSGLNLNSFKNQIGMFHSPSKVLICTDFLASLPEDEIWSGYGEILKLHIIGSESLFVDLASTLEEKGFRSDKTLEHILASLKVKQKIIEIDEYEKDLRRILNYGHTFGHALEALCHNEIPHGIGVAFGLDLVNSISVGLGLLSWEDFAKIHNVVEKYYSYSLSYEVTAEALISASRRDKKVANGKINLALLESPGSLKIVPAEFDERLETAVAHYLSMSKVILQK